MKKLSLKHKVAIAELVVVVIIALAIFGPRSFSQTMGGDFSAENVAQVQILLQGAGDKTGDNREIVLTPDQEEYQALLSRLESKHYIPYYVDPDTQSQRTAVDYWITILFTQSEDQGVWVWSLADGLLVDITREDGQSHTYRLTKGQAFQQELQEFLLQLDYADAA